MKKKKMIKTTAILLAASMVLTGTAVTASAQETSSAGVTSGTGEASVKTMAVKKKVKKKSVTMKVGKKKTIKVKTKKASIKTSNKKVVSVKKKKVGKNKYKYTLKAKKTGTATVTYKKGNRKVRLKVTVKKSGQGKDANSTTEYHYEAYCLFDETYTDTVTPFYFRTDNPGDFGPYKDWYVYITDANGDKAKRTSYQCMRYGDISYTSTYYLNESGDKIIYSYPPVSDGTIYSVGLSKVGTYTIHFVENETGNEYETCYDFTIDNDYTACETEFINSVIEEVTTDDMTNPEKMTAISNYLYNLFSYFPNYIDEDGTQQLADLTTDYLPWYVNYCVNSYTSPKILVKFANAIGYENCRSLYGDSNYNWYLYHWYMICDDDGLLYQCCPLSSTGLLEGVSSKDDIPKIDLSSYQLN